MAGDVEAFVQETARLHHRDLVRAMALVCGDVSDAEDAVQDAFLALWQTLRRGEIVASPRSWLVTASMNRLRSGWRRTIVRAGYLEGAARIHATRDGEADQADAMTLREELAKLPARQRQATVLFYFLDLSVEDTANAMGTSTGMVKNALFRARRTVAAALGEPVEEVPR